MVCPACEKKAEKERDLAEELVSKWARGELVERKKGKWKQTTKNLSSCSSCGNCILTDRTAGCFYCPNCGADMRGDETDG